jgi:hypothetical protein
MPESLLPGSKGDPARRSDSGGSYAKLLVTAGALLMVLSVALTFAKVGATTTRTVSRSVVHSAPTTTSVESPTSFLDQLAQAMRSGDVNFMVSRLNPAVIARYGSAACRTAAGTYADPTAAFAVQSVSSPGDYTYTAAGTTSVIPNSITAQVTFTHKGPAVPITAHLSRSDAGTWTWYTNCSPPPSG